MLSARNWSQVLARVNSVFAKFIEYFLGATATVLIIFFPLTTVNKLWQLTPAKSLEGWAGRGKSKKLKGGSKWKARSQRGKIKNVKRN